MIQEWNVIVVVNKSTTICHTLASNTHRVLFDTDILTFPFVALMQSTVYFIIMVFAHDLALHKRKDISYHHVVMRQQCYVNHFTKDIQYIPRNMHTVFALLCFVVVIHWLIFPYPSGLLHWHCGNLTIAPVPAKQPWWIWINTSCEFIMNVCITTTKQSTTKPCAYFLGYTVWDDTD